MKLLQVTVLFSFCMLTGRVVQAAPVPVVIGTVNEDKLTVYRQSKPVLVMSSISLVASAKKLSAVFPNSILWFGPNTRVVDITNEVLSKLKVLGVKPTQNQAPASAPKFGETQRTAAKAALKALRKLAAATEVGVTKQVYGERLIDAKVDVSENLQELPAGALKTEIQTAMDAYADAASIWDDSFQYQYWAVLFVGTPGEIIKKYSIPVSTSEGDLREITEGDRIIILSTIWGAAKEHMNKATILLGS